MIDKKVAFIGSVGSGKTTIIANLSDTETLGTDVESSIDIGKEMTTVGLDYGEIRVDDELKLGLYGVPGQRKFSFMWDFVKQGLWAVVILVRNNSKESIEELTHLLDYFAVNDKTPCLIGITHTDQASGDPTKNKIKSLLASKGLVLPIYSVDARKKENAELIFRTLIMLEETLNGTPETASVHS
jgi:signal recognition particle receptor subunit beta